MFWKLSEPKPNGPLVAQLVLKILGVKLSATTLQDEIEEHPDYPSLLSIGDVFNKYKVETIAANFAPDQLKNIPPPYITQLKGEKHAIDYFTVVSEVSGETVKMFDPEKRKWSFIPFNDLAKRSSGVVLFAEAMPDAGENNFRQKRREEQWKKYGMFSLAGIVLAILAFFAGKSFFLQGSNAIFPVLFILTSLAGIFTGVLLIWYELDRYNPVIQQICKATKHVNCNAILQSDAAKIGGISWSVIGMSYFVGTLLLLLSQGIIAGGALGVAGWLSMCAIPFTLYSVYYQWKVAKQWCVLCLSVQGVLLLQALIAWQGGWVQSYSSLVLMPENIMLAIASYSTPFLLLVVCLPLLKNVKEAKRSKRELNRLKYDPVIFDAILKKQKNIHDSSTGIGIMIGNPAAANKIIKVCNPYCGPCAKAHTPIEQLLQSNPNVQLQIIFTATTEEADQKRWPVRHLLSIAANRDAATLMQALDDWYLAEEKNYEPFAFKYPMEEDLALQDHKIEAMQTWCRDTGIAHTPTIFVNNHELPNTYSVHDLKTFFIA